MSLSTDEQRSNPPRTRWTWFLCALGVVGAVVALGTAPHQARGAAGQTWTPFVLVAGLLLIGLVAEGDGLFRAAGSHLARAARHGVVLFAGPVLWLALLDARDERIPGSIAGVLSRAAVFGVAGGASFALTPVAGFSCAVGV